MDQYIRSGQRIMKKVSRIKLQAVCETVFSDVFVKDWLYGGTIEPSASYVRCDNAICTGTQPPAVPISMTLL